MIGKHLKMLLSWYMWSFCLFTADIRASNHWAVTESGLIRSKEESPFQLAQPFDLLLFMNQEIRWQNIFALYDNLFKSQRIINSLWDELREHTDIHTAIADNAYCVAAKEIKPHDWHTIILEEGRNMGIPYRDYILYDLKDVGDTGVPDCKKISSLTFSMSSFEHLEAMINREHLNTTSESSLPKKICPGWTVNQYGHWLSEILHKNTTSWLHYNLASIYWAVKGNAPKALECSRRAIHHVPRRYKTIALLGMGSILHQCNKTEDAIIVLEAAVDHNPTYPVSRFALGIAYAAQGALNRSLNQFNVCMKLCKDHEVIDYRNAVLCHMDMLTKMQYTQRIMNKIRIELEEFQDTETLLHKTNVAFLKNMEHKQEYDYKNVDDNCVKIEELTNLKINDIHQDKEMNAILYDIVNNPLYYEDWTNRKGIPTFDVANRLHEAVKETLKGDVQPTVKYNRKTLTRNKTEILKEIGPLPVFPDIFPEMVKISDWQIKEPKKKLQTLDFTEDQVEKATQKKIDNSKVLYPSNMKMGRLKADFDTVTGWPSNWFCQKAKPNFPENIDALYPAFLPFEHKGISLKMMLTDKIGVPAGEEHELPWHPPVCPTDKKYALYSMKKGSKIELASDEVATKLLRTRLLLYVTHEQSDAVTNMQDAEIGHRIFVAIQKKLAPKWVLYTLASLYWRVRGASQHALGCLLAARRAAAARHRDLVLASTASVLAEMGLLDDAYTTGEEAHLINPNEPTTNFLLAQVHRLLKNDRQSMYHLKQVLRLEPQYMNGYARNLINAWACVAKQAHFIKVIDAISDKEECTETASGVSMVCERDGDTCRATNKRCSHRTNRESSTLVRMLELKDDNIQEAPVSKDPYRDSFNDILESVPMERFDTEGHQRSYDLMMKTFAAIPVKCRDERCGFGDYNIQLEDCTAALEVEQWLTVVSFENDLGEPDNLVPTQVAAITPSHRKIPECRVPLDTEEDFFLSRILAVDTENWRPLHMLSQEFRSYYHNYNSPLLGAKLAKYVDTKPTSWTAALSAAVWCGAGGRGACAARCVAAAHALAPRARAHRALRPLVAMLHMQSKPHDALAMAYLAFYTAPKSKTEAFIIGLLQYENGDITKALWMHRYALTIDSSYIAALHCLHAAMCQAAFGKDVNKPHRTST